MVVSSASINEPPASNGAPPGFFPLDPSDPPITIDPPPNPGTYFLPPPANVASLSPSGFIEEPIHTRYTISSYSASSTTSADNGYQTRVIMDWGDGTFSDATTIRTSDYGHGTTFDIDVDHIYVRPGVFFVTATLYQFTNDPQALRHDVLSTQRIDIQLNSAIGKTLKGSVKKAISGIFASIDNLGFAGTTRAGATTIARAATGAQPAVDMQATILWGDGTSSSGLFRSNKSGGFDILGSHAYLNAGTYRVKVLLNTSYDGRFFGNSSFDGSTSGTLFHTAYSLAFVGNVPGNRLPLTFPLLDFNTRDPNDAQPGF